MKLDRVVAATFVDEERAVFLRGLHDGPCRHAAYMQFHVYKLHASGDQPTLQAKLGCPGSARIPDCPTMWFLIGRDVGLPLAHDRSVGMPGVGRASEGGTRRSSLAAWFSSPAMSPQVRGRDLWCGCSCQAGQICTLVLNCI